MKELRVRHAVEKMIDGNQVLTSGGSMCIDVERNFLIDTGDAKPACMLELTMWCDRMKNRMTASYWLSHY